METNSKEHHPDDLLQSLRICDQDVFPTIHCVLTIAVVIPVSTAAPERSFSSLRLLKTYLRRRTGENRLQGLAQMYVHSMEKVDIDDMIKRFASMKKYDIVKCKAGLLHPNKYCILRIGELSYFSY